MKEREREKEMGENLERSEILKFQLDLSDLRGATGFESRERGIRERF